MSQQIEYADGRHNLLLNFRLSMFHETSNNRQTIGYRLIMYVTYIIILLCEHTMPLICTSIFIDTMHLGSFSGPSLVKKKGQAGPGDEATRR